MSETTQSEPTTYKEEPVLVSENDLFDTENGFLGTRHILAKNVPEDHFIYPYLETDYVDLAELHFQPFGFLTARPEMRTRILLEWFACIGEYLLAIEDEETFKPDLIFGRTDENMAGLAKRVGFNVDDPDTGSFYFYGTLDEISEGYKEILIKLEGGLREKFEKRAEKGPDINEILTQFE